MRGGVAMVRDQATCTRPMARPARRAPAAVAASLHAAAEQRSPKPESCEACGRAPPRRRLIRTQAAGARRAPTGAVRTPNTRDSVRHHARYRIGTNYAQLSSQ